MQNRSNMKQDNTADKNITWHHHGVDRTDREKLLGHGGATVWLTGLDNVINFTELTRTT